MTGKTDQFNRFIFDNGNIRGGLVQLGESWQQILGYADYPEPVSQQLGELLAASVLLSATIKFDGSLILQIRGDGPLHTTVAQASNDRTIRGLAHWKEDAQLDGGLQQLFGNGQLVMSLINDGQKPYQGIVGLEGERLSDSLEVYFSQSEQLRTRLWLAADGRQAAGLIIQELPAAQQGQNSEEEWQRIGYLADTVTREEMFGLEAEQLLYRLFHEEQVRLLGSEPVRFSCNCSRERIEQTLLTLGQADLEQLLEEQGDVSVSCDFCNRAYRFDKVDVAQLFAGNVTVSGDSKLH